MRKNTNKILRALALAVMMTTFANAARGNQIEPVAISNFNLIILKENWSDLELGYAGDAAQENLKSADAHDPLFTLNIDHIEAYDWNVQTITLTQQATDQLVDALGRAKSAKPDEMNGIGKLRNLKESLGWSNFIELELRLHAFLIRVDNQVTYGGIFLDAPSQMAISFPVIRVIISNEKAMMALLPIHIPFLMTDPIDAGGNVRQLAIAREAEADMQQQWDFFSKWSIGLAKCESAVKYRAIIRDEQIKQIFGKVKKNKGENPAFKGMELYSWRKETGQWCFAMANGTNRNKFYREVTAPEITIVGLEELKIRLGALNKGERVFWLAGTFDQPKDAGLKFMYPPEDIIKQVVSFGKQHEISVYVTGRRLQ